MTRILNVPEGYENGIEGSAPQFWYGKGPVTGARGPFAAAPVGSIYIYKPSTMFAQSFQKVGVAGNDNDWAALGGSQVIAQTVLRSEFTDGGAALGTFTLGQAIPLGATVLRATLLDVTGFTGNTSATIQVGDGTTVNRYMTGTPSVFTTVAALDLGVVSGVAFHAVAKTPVLTITGSTDFTLITAGKLTVRIAYIF